VDVDEWDWGTLLKEDILSVKKVTKRYDIPLPFCS
jgi:hypothetical protein